jgi:DNA invertase Pin-like site-specific DNA recombinase
MGDSERRQLESAKRWCERKGVSLVDTLTDRGLSGFHGLHVKKGVLGAFVQAVEAGLIKPGSVLLIEKVSRLSREGVKNALQEIVFKLINKGIVLQFIDPDLAFDEEAINGPLMHVLIALLQSAYQESKDKSDYIKACWDRWRQKVAAGEKAAPPPGSLPGWLQWVDYQRDGGRKSGGKVELNPAKAAAVKQIFAWAAEGLGVQRIAARLNDPKLGMPVISRKGAWRLSYVTKLLNDDTVIGNLSYHDPEGNLVTREGFWPAAVTAEAWAKARDMVAKRTAGRTGGSRDKGTQGEVANLLTGLVYDATDGQTMHQITTPVSGRVTRSLVSSGALRRQHGSKFTMLPYQLVENAVLQFVRELKPEDILSGGQRHSDLERKAVVEGTIADLGQRIKRAKARADKGGKDLEDVLDLITKWRGQLKEAAKELDVLEARTSSDAAESLAAAVELVPLMRAAAGEGRNELRSKLKLRIRQVIQTIYLKTFDADPITRAAVLHVTLTGGALRYITLGWARGGKYSGCAFCGLSGVVGKKKDEPHLADKRLSEYAIKPEVREWFAAYAEEAGPLIRQCVDEEIDRRAEIAAYDKATGDDALGRYLASDASLDGTPPPKRTGRPRKGVPHAEG